MALGSDSKISVGEDVNGGYVGADGQSINNTVNLIATPNSNGITIGGIIYGGEVDGNGDAFSGSQCSF